MFGMNDAQRPAPSPYAPYDKRNVLSERITSTALEALSHPDREHESRLKILGLFLDPAAKVIDRALAPFESDDRIPTVYRDRIEDYITRAMERSVMGTSRSPMELSALLDARTPFAWSDRFASACVQSGFKEVSRTRARQSGAEVEKVADHYSAQPFPFTRGWREGLASAEETYLSSIHRAIVEDLRETMETWDERAAPRDVRVRERGDAARTLLGLPQLLVANRSHQRSVAEHLSSTSSRQVLRSSVVTHLDLLAGRATTHVPDELLDLWTDFTVTHARTLLNAPADAIEVIVAGAVVFPERPSSRSRSALRRTLKSLSRRRGWPSMVMRLERSWVTEFFEADKTDQEPPVEAWEAAVNAALSFTDSPLSACGDEPEEIARALFELLAEARSTVTKKVA